MKGPSFFIQLGEMFFIPLLAVLIPILIGQWYGRYRNKKAVAADPVPIGSVVAAAFGLLAFMLAFTFQIVTNRFEKRKELLLEEVTNIRTTYLRAGLIPEPYRSETTKLMVEYVNRRVETLLPLMISLTTTISALR